jgi:hypothetical protein
MQKRAESITHRLNQLRASEIAHCRVVESIERAIKGGEIDEQGGGARERGG